MKYKLIALDIDETLVPNSSNEPSPFLRSALHKAQKKLYVSLITARAQKDFEDFRDSILLAPSYHIFENGSKLINPKGEIEYDLLLDNTEVQEILDVTSPFFDEVGFCMDSHWHLDQDGCAHDNVSGVSFTCFEPEKSYLLQQALTQLSHEYTVSVGRHWERTEWIGILLSHKKASKGEGIKAIQERLHIKPEETIAIGDAAHDATMFEQAGLKVAVENGEQELKDKADIIAPSMLKDGVVEIIEKYILSEV